MNQNLPTTTGLLDVYSVVRDANDANFADNARTHDNLVHLAVVAFEAKNMDEGMHLSRVATVVEALMYATNYDAACVWFGKSSVGREG